MEEDLVKNPPPCRLAFTRMVNRPEPAIDLAEAALLIAKEEYPDLDIARYLLRLDGMAADVRNRAGGADDPARLFTDLGDYLFREQGFRGDTENYYDPRNSFLNEVLDRRLGIPISLSAVYMEVGRRLGVRLHGVGMPGHFLVKYTGSNEEVIVDPFHGGAILSPADCQRILDRVYGGKVGFEPRFLDPIGTRQILIRMLGNLKAIHFNLRAYARTLSAVERLLILNPHAANEVRDRGLLCCQLGRYPEAAVDLEQYLRLVPKAPDAEVIRDHLRSVRLRSASMN
jgi:regulator of sirC expression with transglutaminase-like and TPR domain